MATVGDAFADPHHPRLDPCLADRKPNRASSRVDQIVVKTRPFRVVGSVTTARAPATFEGARLAEKLLVVEPVEEILQDRDVEMRVLAAKVP